MPRHKCPSSGGLHGHIKPKSDGRWQIKIYASNGDLVSANQYADSEEQAFDGLVRTVAGIRRILAEHGLSA